MAFCPECGKSAAAEASRCVHCGHEFEDKKTAGKPGSRFKGTMMMTGPAVNPGPTAAVPAPAPAAAAVVATAVTPVAPAAAPGDATPVVRKAGAAKATMIGTGISAGAIAAAKAAAPAQAAVAPAPVSDTSKRNLALAQTQIGTGLPSAAPARAPVAAAAAAQIAAPAPVPTPAAAPVAAPQAAAYEDHEPEDADTRESRYLPGDPMAPNAQQPVAARAPMLRYDDSIASLPRHNPLGDRRFVWIAAGVIGFLCLVLLVVLASKLGN